MKNAQLASLGIAPKSDAQIQRALSRFEAKWQRKAHRS